MIIINIRLKYNISIDYSGKINTRVQFINVFIIIYNLRKIIFCKLLKYIYIFYCDTIPNVLYLFIYFSSSRY